MSRLDRRLTREPGAHATSAQRYRRAFRRTTRRLAGLVGAVVLAGLAVVVAAPAAQASACTDSAGVTVVIDYQGSVSVSCAGSPSTGLGALGAVAGYTFVPRQPGLVCTISGRPATCNGAPTNAYWSYWHGQRGGGWTYSSSGAGSYHPPAGSVEGWSFGAGSPPGISPPAAAPTSTPRPPTTTPRPPSTTAKPPITTPKPSTTRPTTSTPATSRPGTTVKPPTTNRAAATGQAANQPAGTRAVAPATASTTAAVGGGNPLAGATAGRPGTRTAGGAAASTRAPTGTTSRVVSGSVIRPATPTTHSTVGSGNAATGSSSAAGPAAASAIVAAGSNPSSGAPITEVPVADSARSTSSGPVWGLVAGAGVIAAIGAAAVVRARRSH